MNPSSLACDSKWVRQTMQDTYVSFLKFFNRYHNAEEKDTPLGKSWYPAGPVQLWKATIKLNTACWCYWKWKMQLRIWHMINTGNGVLHLCPNNRTTPTHTRSAVQTTSCSMKVYTSLTLLVLENRFIVLSGWILKWKSIKWSQQCVSIYSSSLWIVENALLIIPKSKKK